MKYKIIKNREEEIQKEAEAGIKRMIEKYGKPYCPCSLLQTPEYICPCKNFIELQEEGECHCGRFEKIKITP